MGLSNLRIYVGATRLFTITNYKGYDPSTGSSVGQMGYDYAAIPLSRDFMMGHQTRHVEYQYQDFQVSKHSRHSYHS